MTTEIEPQPGSHGKSEVGAAAHASKTARRLAACGEVAQAVLAIDAAVGTDELSERLDELLRTLQADLSDVRADLSIPLSEKANREPPAYIARIDEVRKQSEIDSRGLPARSASHAAGLLRLSAAATRRAERTARELVQAEPNEVSECAAVYLNHLAALLPVLADRAAHEADRRIAFGACGNPWLHPALAPDLSG